MNTLDDFEIFLLALLPLCLGLVTGILIGNKLSYNKTRDKAIACGVGEYNKTNGTFQFITINTNK